MLLGALGRLLGALGRLLGGSWAAPGPSWAAFGASWPRCQKSVKNLGLAAFFRIKPRKNRGFESQFVPNLRFLQGFEQGAAEGWIGRRQVGGARGEGI